MIRAIGENAYNNMNSFDSIVGTRKTPGHQLTKEDSSFDHWNLSQEPVRRLDDSDMQVTKTKVTYRFLFDFHGSASSSAWEEIKMAEAVVEGLQDGISDIISNESTLQMMHEHYGLEIDESPETHMHNLLDTDNSQRYATDVIFNHTSNLDSGRCMYELLLYGEDIAFHAQNELDSGVGTLSYIGKQAMASQVNFTLSGIQSDLSLDEVTLANLAETTTAFLEDANPNDNVEFLFFRIDDHQFVDGTGSRRLDQVSGSSLEIVGKMHGTLGQGIPTGTFGDTLKSTIETQQTQFIEQLNELVFNNDIPSATMSVTTEETSAGPSFPLTVAESSDSNLANDLVLVTDSGDQSKSVTYIAVCFLFIAMGVMIGFYVKKRRSLRRSAPGPSQGMWQRDPLMKEEENLNLATSLRD